MKLQSYALALATAVAFAAPAIATETTTTTTGVRYADLDLSTESGRQEFDRRLDRAARDVCGMNEKAVGSRISTREARACYRQARAELGRQFATVVSRETFAGS